MEISYPIQKKDVEHLVICPVCNSKDLCFISTVENTEGISFLSTAYCRSCSFVFRNERPSKEWFSGAFVAREQYQRDQQFDHINPDTEKNRYERYLSVGKSIKNLLPSTGNLKVLDVACGTGMGLKAFEDLGFDIFGIDEDRTRALYGISKGIKIDIIAWEKYIPQEKFDVITVLHALEHFHNPVDFLNTVKTWLNPDGGIIVIEVPDFRNFHPNWTDSLYLAHMSNFDENSLSLMAAQCQLESIGRLSHYKDEKENEINLCMAFRLSGSSDTAKVNLKENVSLDSVKDRYRNGLDFLINSDETIKYQVKYINDISLTYKSDLNVDSDLSKNMMKKKLNYNASSSLIEVV